MGSLSAGRPAPRRAQAGKPVPPSGVLESLRYEGNPRVVLKEAGAVGFGTLLCTVGFERRREGKERFGVRTRGAYLRLPGTTGRVGWQPRRSFPSRLAIVCGAKSVPKPTRPGALPSRVSSWMCHRQPVHNVNHAHAAGVAIHSAGSLHSLSPPEPAPSPRPREGLAYYCGSDPSERVAQPRASATARFIFARPVAATHSAGFL